MRAAYLAVLLAACAAPVPRQYAQGVPVAPRAPACDPVFDAPTDTGHPSYVGPVENIPRSPYTRVLPETPKTRREPGIWAVKDPEDGQGELLGVPLPPMADAKDADDLAPMLRCAATMGDAVRATDTNLTLAKAPTNVRICLAATLYRGCIAHDVQRDRGLKAAGERYDREQERRNLETLKVASTFARDACNGVSIEPNIARLYPQVLAWWINAYAK